MICDKCKRDFPEKLIEDSHDVPKYLFVGYPNERKTKADKFGRHWLCKMCHLEYEIALQNYLIGYALEFRNDYFKEVDKDGGQQDI